MPESKRPLITASTTAMRVPLAPEAEKTLMPILSFVETRLSQADFSSGLAVNATMPRWTIWRIGSGCGAKAIVAAGFSTTSTRPIQAFASGPGSLAHSRAMRAQNRHVANQNFIIIGAFLDA